jgi:hypothetical protein
MRIPIALLLALALASFAPAPPALQRATIRPHAVQSIVRPHSARAGARQANPSAIHETARQECTYQLASARLRQQVTDPIGYPFGFVEAFSCNGDAQAVAREFAQRLDALHAAAVAYRAAHPVKGISP